ncbi:hypothetical protein PENTCL1PPCAC_2433 [Pristionchus entomophagus]|uniref:Uncharacterized protein n=1 Tax=Pristionchus entomophagus TaxID=358040 RepID=A0AAV5SDH9_9BILA|nr:hypothetical protein PENTCL1PPCAC_2433 [Pristionchus entomophagus]
MGWNGSVKAVYLTSIMLLLAEICLKNSLEIANRLIDIVRINLDGSPSEFLCCFDIILIVIQEDTFMGRNGRRNSRLDYLPLEIRRKELFFHIFCSQSPFEEQPIEFRIILEDGK